VLFAGISAQLRQRTSRIVILATGYAMFTGVVIWIATPVSIAV
jgi:hypothetical protein